VAQGFQVGALGRVPHGQGRQANFLVLQGGLGVVGAFHIGSEKAGKINAFAGGAKFRFPRFNGHGQMGQPGFRHLGGHRALPN
jgi:hypothetical protein